MSYPDFRFRPEKVVNGRATGVQHEQPCGCYQYRCYTGGWLWARCRQHAHWGP